LRQLGVAEDAVRYGPRYQLLTLGLQAALSGLGIALLPLFVAQTEIASGRARRLARAPFEPEGSYRLLYRKETSNGAALAAFAEWVTEEGRLSEVAVA
jgi:LysR family transcriptional regulator, glycine cleavage system transcriptional activator